MAQQYKTEEATRLLEVIMKMKGYASTTRGRKVIKEGFVKVNGKVVTYPAQDLPAGATVAIFEKPQRTARITLKQLPYDIHHDDPELFAFDKPAGVVSASPDKKRRTAFNIVRDWLFARDPKLEELYFVNKLPKEASGLVLIARDAVTRTRLQKQWNNYTKRYYVIAQGEFPEDGVIGKQTKNAKGKAEGFVFPYRRMMQGAQYALLRVEMKNEAFSELFSLLEAKGNPVPGFARRGKAANPLNRLGFHFFSVEIPESPTSDKLITIKTPVPREFLNLIKFSGRSPNRA